MQSGLTTVQGVPDKGLVVEQAAKEDSQEEKDEMVAVGLDRVLEVGNRDWGKGVAMALAYLALAEAD